MARAPSSSRWRRWTSDGATRSWCRGSPGRRLQPQTKKRHRLDEWYWKRIDPSGYALPNAERLAYREAVFTSHAALLLEPEDVGKVGEAVAKVYDHREELRALAG